MKKKLPVREFKINPKDKSWVNAIAITETPAIMSDFITFSKADPSFQKFESYDEQKELLGIAMKANHLIYRNSPEFGEYNCFFTPETVRLASQIFFKNNFNSNINLEHSEVSAEAFAWQTFIIDSKKGINSPYGLDAKDGDWIIGLKCENDEIFNILKSTNAGFSVEGIFQMLEADFSHQIEDLIEDEESILNAYFQALEKIKGLR